MPFKKFCRIWLSTAPIWIELWNSRGKIRGLSDIGWHPEGAYCQWRTVHLIWMIGQSTIGPTHRQSEEPPALHLAKPSSNTSRLPFRFSFFNRWTNPWVCWSAHRPVARRGLGQPLSWAQISSSRGRRPWSPGSHHFDPWPLDLAGRKLQLSRRYCSRSFWNLRADRIALWAPRMICPKDPWPLLDWSEAHLFLPAACTSSSLTWSIPLQFAGKCCLKCLLYWSLRQMG